jgi:peptidoglycan/LPS O-acetylase OafA/YrhL
MDARSPERADASSAWQLHASAAPASAPRRIAYLESIRGLAAIQVLLLHFFLAFAPDLAAHNPIRRWERRSISLRYIFSMMVFRLFTFSSASAVMS